MADSTEAQEQIVAPPEGKAPVPLPTDTKAPPAEEVAPSVAETPPEETPTPTAAPTVEGEAPPPEESASPSAIITAVGSSPSQAAAAEPSLSEVAAAEASRSISVAAQASPSKAAAVEDSAINVAAVAPPVPTPRKGEAAAPALSEELAAATTRSKEETPPVDGVAPVDGGARPSETAAPTPPAAKAEPPTERMSAADRRRARSKHLLTAASRGSIPNRSSQKDLQDGRGRQSSRQSLLSTRESLMRLRHSYARGWPPTGSFISFRRSSLGFDRIKTVYENTYQLDAERPFSSDRVTQLLREALEGDMSFPERYEPERAAQVTQDVVKLLRTRVKELSYDRCRMICTCEVVERRGQAGAHGLRFLWDSERDRFASYTVETPSYYLVAVIFGVYTD